MTALLIPSIRLFPIWKPDGGVAPVALRRVRRLLHALLPLPRGVGSVLQPF